MVFARLHLYDNDSVKDVFLITPRTRLTIGRNRANTLVLRKSKILPFHAALFCLNNEFVLQTCHPAADIWVNQEAIAPDHLKTLNNGDQILIGNVRLDFDCENIDSQPGIPDSYLPVTLVTPRTSNHILQVIASEWVQEFPLVSPEAYLGNDASCELSLDWPFLAPQQLKLSWHKDSYVVENLFPEVSLTHLGQPVTQKILVNGDTFALDHALTLKYSILATPASTAQVESISLRNRTRIGFGRDPRNDVVLDHPVVSRFHAVLEWQAGTWFIKDLNSSNGTFVNERATQQCVLQFGDVLHIGPYEFQFTPEETLVQRFEVGKLRLDARELRYQLGSSSVTLLDNVSLSFLPEEFVTIVGVSGAGKSTLLNALSGFRPATKGGVFVNGHNLYQNYDAYRTELGYVPQDDIIHIDLTVLQALDFAARLRLPPDVSAPERRRQVYQVLVDLELLEQSKTLVKNLSGGQRKRVSIGVELLTKPSLFFLDEATSGLDPGTELQMMRLLRRMASQGRTVILVTHTTKNLMMSDIVVFLAKGGRIAYLGPPKDALSYFGVEEFDEIYIKVEEEQSPEDWATQYQQSRYYQEFVIHRQEWLSGRTASPNQEPEQVVASSQTSNASSWRQFRLLLHRSLTILFQDRVSFFFLMAVAPILGLLDFVLWQRNMFDVTEGEPSQTFTLLFISVLIAVIVGSLTSMREVVKEAEIYRRERMIGLKILPYVFSKVWLSAVLSLYQAAIFLVTKVIAVDLPGGWQVGVAMYFTLFLATLGGMVMGLLVSALSSSQNVAPLLTVLFLVPQITFAGSFLPLSTIGPVGQTISQMTITRWTYESMVTLSGLGRDVANDPCWQQPDAVRKQWKEADKVKCQCMGPKLFDGCSFPGIRQQFDPAVNQDEPVKPVNPGDPPIAPENLLAEAQQYADDLEAYSEKTKIYRKELDAWQDRFSQWKEKRGRAIAAGEELLSRFKKNQGNTFAVNVVGHWIKLAILILVMLTLLVAVQKRKDWV
jgi:ABC transport system ATP-binding/permease protein